MTNKHINTKIISFYSTKGGVGKTSSCLNIACALSKINLKILIIDMDPTANLSLNSMAMKNNASQLLLSDCQLNKIIKKNVFKNLDIISTTIDLGLNFNDELFDEYQTNLLNNLNSLKDKYDLILIDLSPNISTLNKLVLACSEALLIPLLCNQYAIDSISKTLLFVRKIQAEYNPNLKILGVFINMFDKRISDSVRFLTEVNNIFKKDLFNTIVPKDLNVSKLQAQNKIIVNAASWKPAAIKFSELADEIYKKIILNGE